MGTRGFISFYNPETKYYEGFYNHYDNYLEGTGKKLIESPIATSSINLKDIQRVLKNNETEWIANTLETPYAVILESLNHGCDYAYIRKGHIWYYINLCMLKYGELEHFINTPIIRTVISGLLEEKERQEDY